MWQTEICVYSWFDQQNAFYAFAALFRLNSSGKSAPRWCMQTSAVQLWPCLFARASSKLLGQVLSPENTPVRILLYGFRRMQLYSRPTSMSPTNSARRRNAESVFYFISATKHIQERASSKRLTVANHMLNLLIIREVSEYFGLSGVCGSLLF